MTHEAHNNLMLGLAGILMNSPETYPEFYLSEVIDEDAKTVGAALMTMPHHLIIAHGTSQEALDLIATHTHRLYGTLPGVNSSRDLAEAFARKWTEVSGVPHRRLMQQRIFQIDKVSMPEGGCRIASPRRIRRHRPARGMVRAVRHRRDTARANT
ncbi:MAG: hypothetical protein HND48_13975 [Chloroflexi bacterium]|nr:hypothetical protein [Chloroflexota bacterium]